MPVFVFSDYHAGRINFTFENSHARRIVDTLRAESPCTRVIPTKTLKHSRKKRRKNKSLKANILNLILFKGFTLPAHPFTLPAPMNIVGPFNENCPGLGCLLVFQFPRIYFFYSFGVSLKCVHLLKGSECNVSYKIQQSLAKYFDSSLNNKDERCNMNFFYL